MFRTYPSFGRAEDDPASRAETARVYFEAVGIYETEDIEAAVNNFLNGSAPGHNAAYAPSAPQVAAESRRVMNLRLESLHRAKPPALPPPDIKRTPDSMARVAELTKQAVANLTSVMLTEDAETDRRRKAFQSRVFDRFDPPQTEAEMRRRLGFTVGDPDGEAGDMGGQAA